MQVPLYLTYIWVPIGFIITGIQYIMTVAKNLQSREVYISYEQVDAYEEADVSQPGGERESALGTIAPEPAHRSDYVR